MQVVPTTSRASLTPFEDAVDRLELAVATPAVVQKLLAVLGDPRSTTRDVEAALQGDPALVTRLLKLASSAAYARRPVRDLRAAIQLVGLHELRKLAVTAHFARGGDAFARELWAYALAVAFACERLSTAAGDGRGSEAFLAGLLHDIGTLVMPRLLGPAYVKLAIVPGDDRQCELERETFGFDHADLGAMTAARWNLFPELELVAQLHHDPIAARFLALPTPTVALIELVALARLGFLATSAAVTDGLPANDELMAELATRRGLSIEAVCVHAQEARAQTTVVLGALTAA